MQVLAEVRGTKSPKAGVKEGYESPDVSAGH